MTDLWDGLYQAMSLILSGDADLIDITYRSLVVTVTATLIASTIAIPLAALLCLSQFRGRRAVITVLNALMGLPPVAVGLVLYVLLSRAGPLGVLGLLYTQWAMILAQVVLILPIIASVALQTLSGLWGEYRDLLRSLRATRFQKVATLIVDGRYGLVTACLTGFGRAIGEVGAIMIVGGNIDHATRTLTTAIALETSRGDFALALALGTVLILLAIAVNIAMHSLSRGERRHV